MQHKSLSFNKVLSKNCATNLSIGLYEYFYFKESSLTTTEGLKKDSLFCDAFAEMMCIIFKVNDLKNDFRQILKNDLQDTIHLATHDLGNDKIEEAFQLLGVSRVEIDFWKNIFVLKGKQLLEPIENTEVLKLKLQQGLGINLSEVYSNVDFENYGNKESFELIKKLCVDLSLDIKQFLPMGIYNWHKAQFTNAIKDLKYTFEHLLWLKLKDAPKQQADFISILNSYNSNFINSIESEIQLLKYDLEVDYSAKLKDLIKQHFDINIADTLPQNTTIENLYIGLLNNYSAEEVDIADEKIRSLLFFEGNKEIIEQYLKEHFSSIGESDSNDDTDEPNVIGSIVDASLTKNSNAISINTSANGNGSWVHSGQSEKRKKRGGKRAELLVYNTFQLTEL